MRILHLVRSFLPVTENWLYNQITFNRDCTPSVLCQFTRNEEQFPLDAVYAAYPHLSWQAQAGLLIARLRASFPPAFALEMIARTKPDIIHGHFATESWFHLPAVKRSGIPFVTTLYGIDISMVPRRGLWRKRYARLFEAGAAFIVEGDFMATRLADLGCPAGKINCIPIGVDIETLQRPEGRPISETVRVLFVGLNREKKGALDAAEAFIGAAQKSKNLRLDLVGDGKYRRMVERRLKKTGVIDRCTFHGSIPVRRYRELLAAGDIVLTPSVTASNGDDEGGAPVVAIEAQAAGIPVVGTMHCDIPMVVKNGESGLLVPEHDPGALSAALEKLAANAPLRAAMGRVAAGRAATSHDIRKQVQKIGEVYARCARQQR